MMGESRFGEVQPKRRKGKMEKTILVMDDSSTIREVLKVYLASERYEVVEAENADRGLNLVRLLPVDLVIADIKMPGMDGLVFVRRLRQEKNPRVRGLPVILLTGE